MASTAKSQADAPVRWQQALAVAGVVAICALVPLVPGRIPLGPVPLDAITLTLPLLFVFAFPLLRLVGWRGFAPFGPEAAGLIFLGVALLSVVASASPASAFATWVRYASYLFMIPVIAVATKEWWARRIAMWSLVLAGSATCMQGILQYLNPAAQQAIGLQGLDEAVATRVFATFDNPNFYAEFLVLLFAVTLGLVFLEKGLARWAAMVLLALQTVILLLTYTRGSWLALAAGVAVAMLMIDPRYIWAFFGLGAAGLIVVPGALQRISSIFSLEGTASFRLRLWRITGQIILAHPFFGVGIGRFYDGFKAASVANPDLATGFLVYGAHNSYYAIAAETGVIGGLVFVWLVITVARMGLFYAPRMRTDRAAFLANAAFTAGLIAFALNAMTSNAFQHPRGGVFFWVLAGLMAGLGGTFWDHAAEARVADRKPFELPAWLRSSVFAGAFAWMMRVLPDTWEQADFVRWLASRPIGGGRLVAGSFVGRIVLGPGRAPELGDPAPGEAAAEPAR